MKICFPVEKEEGTESVVYNHFGSASAFVMVDTASNRLTVIHNSDRHHERGACNPAKALENQPVDAVVVGGIGAGALNKLDRMGIKVYRSGARTVRENVELLASGKLVSMTVQHTCIGHGPGGGCAH